MLKGLSPQIPASRTSIFGAGPIWSMIYGYTDTRSLPLKRSEYGGIAHHPFVVVLQPQHHILAFPQIAAIAAATGFCTPSHLSNTFHAATGLR